MRRMSGFRLCALIWDGKRREAVFCVIILFTLQREDDVFSPSYSFNLPPEALFPREEYLHGCLSVVLLFLFQL